MAMLSALFLSLVLTIVLTPLFTRIAARLDLCDVPDARKVHNIPVPRIGGVAIAIGVFASILLWVQGGDMIRGYLIGALILVGFGIADDWKGLGFKAKFAGQLAAALVAVFYGEIMISNLGSLMPDGITLPRGVEVALTLVTIIGVTNAVNLSDGLDGLAGGITMLSFACIGFLAYLEGNLTIAVPAAALVGALFGFLRFNTFPATLFMGDTGSLLLGFSAAFFSIALTQGDTALSPLLPLIILGFPVLDTLTVMGERIVHGRSPFSADKNHFHHRLMRMGLYHSESVIVIYFLQAGLIVSAYLLRFHSERLLLVSYLFFAALVLAFFYWAGARGWRLKRFDFIELVVKGRLRALRGRRLFIKTAFRAVSWGVPALLISICFVPAEVPLFYSVISAGFLVLLCLVWLIRKSWLKPALVVSIYLFIPMAVYLGDTGTASWMKGMPMLLYQLSYLVFVFFILMTLRFTHRMKGFRATPMDFLVLLFPVVFLVLPDLRDLYGVMAVKIMILYFCYEIIMGEVREDIRQVGGMTAAAYLIAAARGVIG
jgi:UDP-GlcNAc:undecaprenyl-phosphate GlcNAc-1-phosphate transferase